jgi:hypothetical protein
VDHAHENYPRTTTRQFRQNGNLVPNFDPKNPAPSMTTILEDLQSVISRFDQQISLLEAIHGRFVGTAPQSIGPADTVPPSTLHEGLLHKRYQLSQLLDRNEVLIQSFDRLF